MDWKDFFKIEEKKPYYKNLMDFIDYSYKIGNIQPERDNLFKAFMVPKFMNIKVVIVGQDPYPGKNIPTGLCFATNNNILTKSLINIFKNIRKSNDLSSIDTSLEYLARQGVFLINRTLLVKIKKPGSMRGNGFEELSKNAIKFINDNLENVVFILWGKDAISLENIINKDKHYIIKSTHPSPLSAYKKTKNLESFFNVDFSRLANDYLKKHNKDMISWDYNK